MEEKKRGKKKRKGKERVDEKKKKKKRQGKNKIKDKKLRNITTIFLQ